MSKKFFILILLVLFILVLSIFVTSQGSGIFGSGSQRTTSETDNCADLAESASQVIEGIPYNSGDGGLLVSAALPDCGSRGRIDLRWNPEFFDGFDSVSAKCFSLSDTIEQNFDNPLSESTFPTSSGRGSLPTCMANGAVIVIPDFG